MKGLRVILVFSLTILMRVIADESLYDYNHKFEIEEKFFDWLKEHKRYPQSGKEFVHWLTNYIRNEEYIMMHNIQESSYKLGHNKFSHLSNEEWKDYIRFGYDKSLLESEEDIKYKYDLFEGVSSSSLPDSVDWVDFGAVTNVKDQGQCGSCWSFSAVGALEGAHYIKYGRLLSFSEQNLVDCDNRRHGGKDHGCNGGVMDNAFSWAQKNNGLCLEEDYKYISGETKSSNTCNETCSKVKELTPINIVDVKPNSDDALMYALTIQPVSVAIEADQKAFQLYKSGVFTAQCGSNIDHGVLAVGYGEYEGIPYYKIKNSWGPDWGIDGYILLARGATVGSKEGQCGVLTSPSFPVL